MQNTKYRYYHNIILASSASMAMTFELVAIPTTRLAYTTLSHHQYIIGIAQADARLPASTIFLTTFLELFFELSIDFMGIDVELQEGVSPAQFFSSWRGNSIAFFGQHVTQPAFGLLIGLWAFNTIPSFIVSCQRGVSLASRVLVESLSHTTRPPTVLRLCRPMHL